MGSLTIKGANKALHHEEPVQIIFHRISGIRGGHSPPIISCFHRIVYFNKCTELVKFRYKASCIEVENEQCFIIVPCTVQRCHSRNWNESFHPPRGLNLVNYLSLMRCLSGQG